MPQAQGVVDILVSGKPPEHRLPQQPDQSVAAVPAGACVGEHVARHRAETESVVEFAVGQQSGIGGDPGAMELELQPAVEIEPQRAIDRFTRRVRHDGSIAVQINILIIIPNLPQNHIKLPRHPANAG